MAKKAQKKVTKKTTKPAAKKVVKARDYYYCAFVWSSGSRGNGHVARLHDQDKGSPFDIFAAQQAVYDYLSPHVGKDTTAILLNFQKVTQVEGELYIAKAKEDEQRKREEFVAAQEAAKKAKEEADAKQAEKAMPEVAETTIAEVPSLDSVETLDQAGPEGLRVVDEEEGGMQWEESDTPAFREEPTLN